MMTAGFTENRIAGGADMMTSGMTAIIIKSLALQTASEGKSW